MFLTIEYRSTLLPVPTELTQSNSRSPMEAEQAFVDLHLSKKNLQPKGFKKFLDLNLEKFTAEIK